MLSLRSRRVLKHLREWYGAYWTLAIAEHWEEHTSLDDLLAYVSYMEVANR